MSTIDAPAPSPRPMRADARRNYELLLTAANAAFAEHGIEASLEDIARRAGVGIGTLYRHFPTREALAMAVYREQIEALRAQAEDLLDAPSPGEALAAWLRTYVIFGSTQRGLAEFLKGTMRDDEQRSSLKWCKEVLRSGGGALLTRAQQTGTVRTDIEIADLLKLAHAISWAADGVDRTDRLVSLVLDGLWHESPAKEADRATV